MVTIIIRLVGDKKDRLFNLIELDPQILVNDLKMKIKTVTNIPPLFQHIQFRGDTLPNSLHPLESITDFEEIVVSHDMMINWRTYIQSIEKIRQMTTSSVTSERREIALNARVQLSPLYSSKFFVAYPNLAIEDLNIIKSLHFLVHNTKKYLDRSVLTYFQALYPQQKVELKDKPKEFAGIHLGVFVFVDDVASYYAKTFGRITDPEEEIDFPNRPTIDLLEIFVYILLKLIGLGSLEVHVIPEKNKSELVFIATKLIDGFRTASGVSATQILENSSSEETGRVLIDTEMKGQMKILSSLLCLNDLQRNMGNHGVVEQHLNEVEKRKGKNGCELRIVDFGVSIGSIDYEPGILKSTLDIPFLKTYFEKWDFLNNIYKARDEMENDPAIKNNKNVNQITFDRYFERLETALLKFLYH